jgi:hypothetical protein
MTQEDKASSGVKTMNGFKRWQAQDKIADSTLVDNKKGLHNFPVRPVYSQN